jgi:hypothetical protein
MTRDDIIRMAREAGLASYPGWVTDGEGLENLERFAALIAAAEREECAKVCDRNAEEFIEMRVWADDFANELGRAIRARGQG